MEDASVREEISFRKYPFTAHTLIEMRDTTDHLRRNSWALRSDARQDT